MYNLHTACYQYFNENRINNTFSAKYKQNGLGYFEEKPNYISTAN